MTRNSLYSLTGFKIGFAAAQILPRAVSRCFGRKIALAAYARLPQVQATLAANLRRVTGREGAALDALSRANVANFGHMLADYFLCAGIDAARKAQRLLEEWRGIEHLEAARAAGRGTIVVTAHSGTGSSAAFSSRGTAGR